MEQIIKKVLEWLGDRTVAVADLRSEIEKHIGGQILNGDTDYIVNKMLENGDISIINGDCKARQATPVPMAPNKNPSSKQSTTACPMVNLSAFLKTRIPITRSSFHSICDSRPILLWN